MAAGGNTRVISCSFLEQDGTNIYTLADGSYFMLHDDENANDIFLQYLTIDINGAKGPNKWGYDVFYYTLRRDTMDSKLELSDQYCSMREKGGYTPTKMLTND